MTAEPETTVLRQRIVRVITQRASSSTDASGVAAAARRTHEELTAVFAPLISSAGVEALSGGHSIWPNGSIQPTSAVATTLRPTSLSAR